MTLAPAPAADVGLADEQRDVARTRIVRAARRTLAARGMATTVDDVAATAGVSRRTVFRHFGTREALFAVAIRDRLRSYAEQLAPPTEGEDGDEWLRRTLVTVHRINARNGRIFWELATHESELTGELAAAAAECRVARKRFAGNVAAGLWQAAGGTGWPPDWVTDAVSVQLSGFTTHSLASDLDRTPEEVAASAEKVLRAVVAAAVASPA
jgi:AcrR family transcriptional regulator